MIQKSKWHFNLPTKVREILEVLKSKAETKSCVDVEDVTDLINKLSWNNLPMIIEDALKLVGVITPKEKTLPKWIKTPSRVELLYNSVMNLDCRSVTTEPVEVDPQDITKIKLVEYDAEEDLTGENEEVSFEVYFEDKSGDEIPNIGKKLFLDEEMLKPLEGYKGAFYFIRPSEPDKKISMLVRSTGTVKKTRFEV